MKKENILTFVSLLIGGIALITSIVFGYTTFRLSAELEELKTNYNDFTANSVEIDKQFEELFLLQGDINQALIDSLK